MTGHYQSDDELMKRLGRVLAQVDPVPEAVIQAAVISGTWRSIDAELAALMYDSVLDRNEWVGVRGGGSRMLSFTSRDLTIDLEVLDAGRGLIGQVGGADVARIDICFADETVSVDADEIGHFSSPRVRPGPMRIRVTDSTGTVVQTEWVVV